MEVTFRRKSFKNFVWWEEASIWKKALWPRDLNAKEVHFHSRSYIIELLVETASESSEISRKNVTGRGSKNLRRTRKHSDKATSKVRGCWSEYFRTQSELFEMKCDEIGCHLKRLPWTVRLGPVKRMSVDAQSFQVACRVDWPLSLSLWLLCKWGRFNISTRTPCIIDEQAAERIKSTGRRPRHFLRFFQLLVELTGMLNASKKLKDPAIGPTNPPRDRIRHGPDWQFYHVQATKGDTSPTGGTWTSLPLKTDISVEIFLWKKKQNKSQTEMFRGGRQVAPPRKMFTTRSAGRWSASDAVNLFLDREASPPVRRLNCNV